MREVFRINPCVMFIGLLAEIQMNDYGVVRREEGEDFDYSQFVMEDVEGENQSESSQYNNGATPIESDEVMKTANFSQPQSQENLSSQNPQSSAKSVKFNVNAKEELIKDPKMDLKQRVKESAKKPSKTHKNIVKIVNLNTKQYNDYQYEQHSNPSESLILFAKDVPSELIRSEPSEKEESVSGNILPAEEEMKQEPEPEVQEEQDPYKIFEEVFDEVKIFLVRQYILGTCFPTCGTPRS
jgi:hypothetical protein